MLKALILPLIIPSLIAAIGQLDMSLSGKVGGRAVAYYMITTVLAVILGIILVTTIRPGASAKIDKDAKGVRIKLHFITVNYFIHFNYLKLILSII
jgi:Na+/H+-dicarboxylate symporter